MLRDDFIAQMIAELTRQKDNDENSFNHPRVCSPKEIFQSLCYDFPITSPAELLILSDCINNFAVSSSHDQISDNFWLADKFLENLKYLSGSPDRSGEIDKEKAISKLCAAVFLRLPFRLLSMTRGELSSIFCCLSSSLENESGHCNPNLTPSGAPLLSWQEICLRYRHFVLQGTASLVANMEATTLVSKYDGKAKTSDCEGCLVEISKAIKSIQWDSNTVKAVEFSDSDSMTLEQCFLLNSMKVAKMDVDQVDDVMNIDLLNITATSDTTESQNGESESYFIRGVAKDVWVHLSFLNRDLLVHYPEILNHSSALPAVLGALLSSTGTGGRNSAFPSAPECMFVLILAGVIAGITAPPAPQSHSPHGNILGEGGTTAEILQSNHEKLRSRAARSLEACTGLRKYLESSSPSLLGTAVSICERMSGGSTNCDGAVLLCDITSVYSKDNRHVVPHPHEHLISGRAVSALAQMWISTASNHFRSAEAVVHLPASSSSTASIHSVTSRIVQTLSLLCLQRPDTAVFLLKIPRFNATVLQACQQWQQMTKNGVEESEVGKGDNGFLLLPGDAVGLITALSLAAASVPSSPMECAFKALYECLESALSIVETNLTGHSSSIASASERKQHGQIDFTLVAPEDQTSELVLSNAARMVGRRRRRQFVLPRGLISSLKLITDEDGGARTLRAVSTSRQSAQTSTQSQAQAQSVVAVLKSWSTKVLKGGYAARSRAKTDALRQVPSSLPPPNVSRKEEEVFGNVNVSIELSTGSCVDIPCESGRSEDYSHSQEQLEGQGKGTEAGVGKLDDKDKDKDEDEEGSGSEVEEVRRLLKALQALLLGFSTNKTD